MLLTTMLGNSGKNFPSSGVPSFAECSCQKHSAKNFFKKIKKRLCRRPLHRTLSTRFFQKKIERPSLPTASAPDPRHRIFFSKNRKTIFAYGFCSGLSAQNFQKKIKSPSLPTALSRGRRQRNFQKPLS
jgi:hypothetical protein